MKYLVSSLIILSCCIFSLSVYADYSISFEPFEGGTDLRFSPVTGSDIVTQESKIRITSDVTVRYEITQQLLDPLRNDRGVELNSDVIKFYTLTASNAYGSLYNTDPAQLEVFEKTLYVSSSDGLSDSFNLVYVLDASKANASGRFFSRLLVDLMPTGGNGTEQRLIVNISVDLERKLDVDVVTSSNSSRELKITTSEAELSGYIKMDINATTNQDFDIIQTLEDPFLNEKGENFPLEHLKFYVSAQSGQSNYPSLVALEKRSMPIYSSATTNKDEVVINFALSKEDLEKLPSGNYRTRLHYTFNDKGEVLKEISIDLNLKVLPVFEIKVSSSTEGGLYFRGLSPENSPLYKEIIINVKTNMNRPYSVTQTMQMPLKTVGGDEVSSKYFTLREEQAKGSTGTILFPQSEVVKTGETTLFNSDSKGSSSEFRIIYSLEFSTDVFSGDYFTTLSYSLVER